MKVMSQSQTVLKKNLNPFRKEDEKPTWAQFSRLGGDRVAIHFEELRTKIAVIPGLIEELHFFGPEEGWLPRYRVGDRVLFKIHILPGELGATIEMEELLFNKFLNSSKLAGNVRAWLGTATIREGIALLRMRLTNRSEIGSLGSFIIKLSREQV